MPYISKILNCFKWKACMLHPKIYIPELSAASDMGYCVMQSVGLLSSPSTTICVIRKISIVLITQEGERLCVQASYPQFS